MLFWFKPDLGRMANMSRDTWNIPKNRPNSLSDSLAALFNVFICVAALERITRRRRSADCAQEDKVMSCTAESRFLH